VADSGQNVVLHAPSGGEELSTAFRAVPVAHLDRKAWDAFAKLCGCSVKSTQAHLTGWRIKNQLHYRLRLFEIYWMYGRAWRKVGQCALGIAKQGKHFFLDRLQLLPGHEHLWTGAMQAVLENTGRGVYEYGWELNPEPPRSDDLAAIPGVGIEDETPLVVQAIDFSRWGSWDDYFRDLRKGARQSAQFAYRDIPDLGFVTLKGRRAILGLPALVRLKMQLSRRKGIGVKLRELVTSYLGAALLSPEHTITRLARGHGRVLAAYYGAEFGGNYLYLEAASEAGNQGASWALLLSMIQRSYENDPRGQFIMGYVNYALHDEELSGGLIRSRTACRASDYPTSIVVFRYAPAA
jgi:hypothetical protein